MGERDAALDGGQGGARRSQGGRGLGVLIDTAEGEAVQGAGTKLRDGGAVRGGRVAFMGSEAVAWEAQVGVGHPLVAADLGQDGRRGDVPAQVVAVDDALGVPRAREGLLAIDEDAGCGAGGAEGAEGA